MLCNLGCFQHVQLLTDQVHVEMFYDVHSIFCLIVSNNTLQYLVVCLFCHQLTFIPCDPFEIHDQILTLTHSTLTTTFDQDVGGMRVSIPVNAFSSFIQ